MLLDLHGRFSVEDLEVQGIPSGEDVPAPSVTVPAGPIFTQSIPPVSNVGTPEIRAPRVVEPTGVPSAEAFGTAVLRMQVVVAAIGPQAAVGQPSVSLVIQPTGWSGAAFGTPSVGSSVSAQGITPSAALGVPKVVLGITVAGIGTGEAFGITSLTVILVRARAVSQASVLTTSEGTVGKAARAVGDVTLVKEAEAVYA